MNARMKARGFVFLVMASGLALFIFVARLVAEICNCRFGVPTVINVIVVVVALVVLAVCDEYHRHKFRRGLSGLLATYCSGELQRLFT